MSILIVHQPGAIKARRQPTFAVGFADCYPLPAAPQPTPIRASFIIWNMYFKP
jgi:hypothetical protein